MKHPRFPNSNVGLIVEDQEVQILDICHSFGENGKAQSIWKRCFFDPSAMVTMQENECQFIYPTNARYPDFEYTSNPYPNKPLATESDYGIGATNIHRVI